ncbi:pentapeptide repeat-containing protein, partial [Microcoleus sp. herbarium14]|uniref:pentapeptide repeat-containing protein n=1 Tax=Microcoleus sp. herbarium14 TaxID=3055439 RepID=UPI002FD5D607
SPRNNPAPARSVFNMELADPRGGLYTDKGDPCRPGHLGAIQKKSIKLEWPYMGDGVPSWWNEETTPTPTPVAPTPTPVTPTPTPTVEVVWPFPLKNDDLQKLLLWFYYYQGRRDFPYSYLYKIDLSFKDMRYINLSFSYLLGANFAASNLMAANLGYAYLCYAYLGYAYIGYSYLGYAYLAFADLSHANLTHSDLSYAYLGYAKLKGTNLRYANLSYAYLVGADLSNADLTGANLTGTILIGANLTGVKLTAEQQQVLATPLWYSIHQGQEGKTTSVDYTDVPDFGKLTIDLTEDTELLLTLNVPDTWNNKEGIHSWFAIAVDGKIFAVGLYSSATPGQRVPLSVSSVKKFTKGTYSVTAQWKTDQGGELAIGPYGTAILTAMTVS